MQFLKAFEREHIISTNGDQILLNPTKRGKFRFLVCLLQAIVDSYFVVISVIYEISQQRIVLEQSKLLKELHICV
jgi:hypothetical protein